jgi:hypothetical protein
MTVYQIDPCFSLMEGPSGSLVQRFRFIISLASLAYTFTVLHAIQYSMQNPDDSTTRNLPDHDSTDYSTLSSTNDTLATTSTAGTTEKSNKRWSVQEINLLLDYIERNSILTTARGLNLKKSEYKKASEMVKTRDAVQCQRKWANVGGIFVINEDSDHYLSIIAMFYLQGNFALGQEVWL